MRVMPAPQGREYVNVLAFAGAFWSLWREFSAGVQSHG
jgi:hypothetical protein